MQADTEKPLPSRVIDVGDDNTPPKLITTGGKLGIWIALSYCWGGDSVFIHNDSTVADLLTSADHLPTAFDALCGAA